MSARCEEVLTVRLAGPTDRPALERLAGRDSTQVPEGEVVIAVVDGELRAAVTVSRGRVVADPFRPTAELVEVLRLRAAQLRRHRRVGLRARVRRDPPSRWVPSGLTRRYAVAGLRSGCPTGGTSARARARRAAPGR